MNRRAISVSSLIAGCLILSLSAWATPVTAKAANFECTGTQQVLYSPGITDDPQFVTFDGFAVAGPHGGNPCATRPGKALMPQVTLSNGQKTVVFQGMIHIGSETFYKSVVYDLEEALSDGYRLYYEGVMPSTPEGDRWFSANLADGGDLGDNYKALASACGLQYQIDYFGLLAKDMVEHPQRHLTADVSTIQMKEEYDRLMRTDPAFAERVKMKGKSSEKPEPAQGPDLLTRFIAWHQHGSEDQKNLAGLVCRGVFTVALGHSDKKDPSPLDPVVLDFRNRHLAGQILSEPNDKIYVTYGAEHLRGVLGLLQSKDSRWQVKSVKWTRAIANPEHFERKL